MTEEYRRPDRTLRLTAICGVVGPVVYAVGVVLAGLVRPGYSHVEQRISELGELGTPSSTVWNTALIVVGLLVVLFSFGLHRGTVGSKTSPVGPALIAAFGVALFSEAFFPCDPGCINVSTIGLVHGLIGNIGLLCLILGMLIFSRRLRKDRRWQGYSLYSIVTGALILSVMVGFIFSFATLTDMGIGGAAQRVWFSIPILWIEVMAIRLLRVSVQPSLLSVQA